MESSTGRRLYNELGLVATRYRDWFAEGTPAEWVRALDHIQAVLTACKREAADADRAHRARLAAAQQLPLLPEAAGHEPVLEDRPCRAAAPRP